MSDYAWLLREPVVLQLGWALVHFLWEGTVVALLVAAALRAMRGRSAEGRYAASCVGLLVMAACPVVTFLLLPPVGPVVEPEPSRFVVNTKGLSIWQLDGPTLNRLISESRPAQPGESPVHRAAVRSVAAAASYVPWFAAFWAAGVLVLAVWLIGSWGEVIAVSREAHPSTNRALVAALDGLVIRMRISWPVRLLESARVQVPAVVGAVRPVVLFPAAALTGLTPRQIEFILAHELAHVRRHDYLVNLLQSAAEAVLFYHPLVWWVSSRIRTEREHCCDDAAVEACGDRAAYATALADLEELRASMIRLSIAACGTALLPRVRRLLQPASPDRGRSWASGATAAALVVLLVAVCVARGAHTLVEPRPPVPVFVEGTFGGNVLEPVNLTEHVTAIPNPLAPTGYDENVVRLGLPPAIRDAIIRDAGYCPIPGKPLFLFAAWSKTPSPGGHVSLDMPWRSRNSGGGREFGFTIQANESSFDVAPGSARLKGEIDLSIEESRRYVIRFDARFRMIPTPEHPDVFHPADADVTWEGPIWKGAVDAAGKTVRTATLPKGYAPQDMMPTLPRKEYRPKAYVNVPQDVINRDMERQAQAMMRDMAEQLPPGPQRDAVLKHLQEHPMKFPVTRPSH